MPEDRDKFTELALQAHALIITCDEKTDDWKSVSHKKNRGSYSRRAGRGKQHENREPQEERKNNDDDEKSDKSSRSKKSTPLKV